MALFKTLNRCFKCGSFIQVSLCYCILFESYAHVCTLWRRYIVVIKAQSRNLNGAHSTSNGPFDMLVAIWKYIYSKIIQAEVKIP